jgi:FixJ family two-component response regulator
MMGAELVAAIRSERPDLPIILATGYSELHASIDPTIFRLSKPFVQADLSRAIAVATEPEAQVLAFRPK